MNRSSRDGLIIATYYILALIGLGTMIYVVASMVEKFL